MLIDEQFKIVNSSSGFEQVGDEDQLKLFLKTGLPISQNGYLYVYTSNESPVDVFFDNLQVTHVRGPLLEETHYYPFGLTMAGISGKASNFGQPGNKYKYNGIELDEDLGINTYEAFYRELDPSIGRWWQIDPKVDAGYESWSPYVSMYNSPTRFSDPLGDEGGDDPIFSFQNFKDNWSRIGDKISNLANQAVSNLKDNWENGRTLPQILAREFHENSLGSITGLGSLEARAVPFIVKELEVLKVEINTAKTEVKAVKTSEVNVQSAYKRPNNATTPAQRASVQGKPCVKCGTEGETMVAGHKKALVKEHYETGTIDKKRMRSKEAVQPECQTCSAKEGAEMSKYSKEQKKKNGF